MAYGVWQQIIKNDRGDSIPAVSVRFEDEETGALAQVYSDINGTPSPGNPKTTDDKGFLRVYLETGKRYKITISKTVESFLRWRVVLPFRFHHVLRDVVAADVAVGSQIIAASSKTTPVDADTMPLIDSAASNALKKVTWANIKATLKNYFDSWYPIYARGTYTGTGTGFSAPPTMNVHWRMTGKLIHIYIENFTSASNATTFTITGAPANIRPINGCGVQLIRATDGGATVSAYMSMDVSGVLTITRLDGSAWNAAGNKGITLFNGLTYLKDLSDP